MAWRVAKALLTLREQVNKGAPNRSKVADGSIGDAAHASRSSDHNPWVKDKKGQPIVTAIDITHDPKNGCDSYKLAEALRRSKDVRLKYVISNHRIFSAVQAPLWQWRKYSRKNPHDHHVHISVKEKDEFFDSEQLWQPGGYLGLKDKEAEPAIKVPSILKKGASGPDVKKLQKKLGIEETGKFDDATHAAVVKFQKANKLAADGIVGPYTWEKLNA